MPVNGWLRVALIRNGTHRIRPDHNYFHHFSFIPIQIEFIIQTATPMENDFAAPGNSSGSQATTHEKMAILTCNRAGRKRPRPIMQSASRSAKPQRKAPTPASFTSLVLSFSYAFLTSRNVYFAELPGWSRWTQARRVTDMAAVLDRGGRECPVEIKRQLLAHLQEKLLPEDPSYNLVNQVPPA